MADQQRSYNLGDKLILKDISQAPEGAWVVKETMQFLRAQDGKSVISLTPIEGGSYPVNRTPDRFTLVYAGPLNVEKSIAVTTAFNHL